MIADPRPNLTARPYRGLSVQDIDVELDEAALLAWIVGRDVYRRTDFLLVRNNGAAALLALQREDGSGLFAPVVAARVLAGAGAVLLLDSPDTDVGNATALAEVAGRHRAPGVTAYAVTGRYQHVNFIWEPAPVRLYVDEVVPPHPPKLVEMARQAIGFDEDLPPVRLVSRLIPLPMLMRTADSAHYLLPCRGAGAGAGTGTGADGRVGYLDAGPARRDDWTLVGCARSEQIYRHHYGAGPARIDFCPELVGAGAGPRLTKCCLLERGVRVSGDVAVVPWGANLDEVRAAVTALVAR